MTECVWIHDLGKPLPDQPDRLLGGKGSRLAELAALRYNVPAGFVITTAVFEWVCREHKLPFDQWPSGFDPTDGNTAIQLMKATRVKVEEAALPPFLSSVMLTALDSIGAGLIAVRSSADSEDGQHDSYAGQFDTFLNVRRDTFLQAVHGCWASLYTDRALAYGRDKRRWPRMAIVVQKMVPADVSGVCFTRHPVTGDPDRLHIDAVWGLGESLVSGDVTPDAYEVDKRTTTVVSKTAGGQDRMAAASENGTTLIPVPPALAAREKLSAAALSEVVRTAIDLERLVGLACDIEWAIAGRSLFILQCRPITR